MRRNAYAEAAERYRDPLRIGTALYRAGELKEAAQAFGRLKSPEGQFNRGNALVMQGKYAEAVEAYETTLAARPDWREAEMNREIARLRAENLKKEGGDLTGGCSPSMKARLLPERMTTPVRRKPCKAVTPFRIWSCRPCGCGVSKQSPLIFSRPSLPIK